MAVLLFCAQCTSVFETLGPQECTFSAGSSPEPEEIRKVIPFAIRAQPPIPAQPQPASEPLTLNGTPSACETVRHVLDSQRSKCHHRPPLLPMSHTPQKALLSRDREGAVDGASIL